MLLVDADPAGGDVLPGLLAGRAGAERGVLTWATATRRTSALEAVTATEAHVVALPEAPQVWVMAGLTSPVQAGGVVPGWARIAQALSRVPVVTGRDVIVDAGRLGESSCWPLIAAADRVGLVARGTARSVTATVSALEMITAKVGDVEGVWLLSVATGPYSPGEVADATVARAWAWSPSIPAPLPR